MITAATVGEQKFVNINANKQKAPKLQVNPETGALELVRTVVDVITPPPGIEDAMIIEEALALAQNPQRWETLAKAVEHFIGQLSGESTVVQRQKGKKRVTPAEKLEVLNKHMPTSAENAVDVNELAKVATGIGTINKALLDKLYPENLGSKKVKSSRGLDKWVFWLKGVPGNKSAAKADKPSK